ncbi:MAG: hypothetical protein DI629_12035 [Mesorhizobium amorphae]|nr:MAG: hypothetical protein DI629_12035 [Mesorhizobium amorphae]
MGAAFTAIDAFGRLETVGRNKLVEPIRGYEPTLEGADITILCSIGAQPPKAEAAGQENFVFAGFGSKCGSANVRIKGSRNVVFFGPYCAPGISKIQITGDNCLFYFGAFSTCVDQTVILGGESGTISFGDDCMLSARVIASNQDGHGIFDLSTGLLINENRDIHIADHVWVGRSVILAKGCAVGRDTVVGQGSLVVKSHADENVVLVGSPAAVKRTGVTWSRWKLPSLDAIAASSRQAGRDRQVAELRRRIDDLS